jgi:hypothetical protein
MRIVQIKAVPEKEGLTSSPFDVLRSGDAFPEIDHPDAALAVIKFIVSGDDQRSPRRANCPSSRANLGLSFAPGVCRCFSPTGHRLRGNLFLPEM